MWILLKLLGYCLSDSPTFVPYCYSDFIIKIGSYFVKIIKGAIIVVLVVPMSLVARIEAIAGLIRLEGSFNFIVAHYEVSCTFR